jgi:hypothetical protein
VACDGPREVLGPVVGVAAPRGRRGRRPLDAGHGVDEAPGEHHPAGLAVGEDVQAAVVLQGDGLVDGAVLHALVLARRERAVLQPLACVEQVLRAQERPDVLGPVHHG